MNKIILLGFLLVIFAGLAESCKCQRKPCRTEIPDVLVAGVGRRKRSIDVLDNYSAVDGMDIVVAADDDGNKMLDYEEASQYLHHKNKRSVNNADSEWFTSLDTNSDGYLSAQELIQWNES